MATHQFFDSLPAWDHPERTERGKVLDGCNNEESRVDVRWHETNTKVSRNNVSVKGLSQTGIKKAS